MTTKPILPRPPRRLGLWSCLWGGGVAWGVHLMAVWLIAEFGCVGGLVKPGPLGFSGVAWLVIFTSATCLVLAALATFASWRHARSEAGNPASFVAGVGLVANPLFMLVIVAQTLPVFFYLRECGSYFP